MSSELLYPERFGIPELEGNKPMVPSNCYTLGMVINEVSVLMNYFLLMVNWRYSKSYVDNTYIMKFHQTS